MAARAQGSWNGVGGEIGKGEPNPQSGGRPAIRNRRGRRAIHRLRVGHSVFPVLNNGSTRSPGAEPSARQAGVALQQAQRRTVSQVRSAVSKWNRAGIRIGQRHRRLDRGTRQGSRKHGAALRGRPKPIWPSSPRRQRLIQLKNARIDAVFQATIAQADLLTALGVPT